MITEASPDRRRAIGVRLLVVSAVAALASTVGLVAVTPPADAAPASSSEVTITWRGGNSPELQRHQVDHQRLLANPDGTDAGTGHWDDFGDLEVTVSQTKNLRDQAVIVTAKGMGPTSFTTTQAPEGNFLQAFQCWGPDPLASDFAQTCQYGGWSGEASTGKAPEDMYRVLGFADLQTRGGRSAHAVPFQAVTKQTSQPGTVNGALLDGTAAFFDASTSNEQPIVYFDDKGEARFPFAVQTAATQPYLGCGSKQLAGMRCWLVIVPRGMHSGERPSSDGLDCIGAVYGGRPSGEVLSRQAGSPLTPSCNFFENRIVVPLDFAEPTSGCAPGSPETRVLGSEFVAEAMSSWQRGLCAEDGLAYSLTTNSGDVTRSQLLSGQANVAIVANRFTASNVGETGEALLEEADLAYAPIANAALTVSFVASNLGSVRADPTKLTVWRDLKITPRLLAKSLTQSYSNDAPFIANTGYVDELLDGNPQSMAGTVGDPEWRALGNPSIIPSDFFGTLVVSGPAGEDVVELLWKYIQSDADAVAFLRGEPDPWGMRINPYYLPSTNAAAMGGGLPYDLAVDPIDTFPRHDQRVVPDAKTAAEQYRGIQLDSVAKFPYSGSFSANAARILRADSKLTNNWDPNKDVSPGVRGAWVAVTPQVGGSRYLAGVADAASAARYGIDSMQLALPVAERTTKETVAASRTFVAPTEASMTAAVSAMKIDEKGFAAPDFAALPKDAYPVTATLYAAVNTASIDLDAAKREQVATLLDYTSGAGNAPGIDPGQLPEGYAPLTPAQIERSAATAALLRTAPGEDAVSDAAAGAAGVPAAGSPGGTPVAPPVAAPADGPAAATTVDAAAVTTTEATAAGAPGSQAALGGTLLAGLAGLLASPFLLRRRAVST